MYGFLERVYVLVETIDSRCAGLYRYDFDEKKEKKEVQEIIYRREYSSKRFVLGPSRIVQEYCEVRTMRFTKCTGVFIGLCEHNRTIGKCRLFLTWLNSDLS